MGLLRVRRAGRSQVPRTGNFGDCHGVGDGIFEFRFFIGPGYRVYFISDSTDRIVVLNGGDHDSQSRDIPIAIEEAQR